MKLLELQIEQYGHYSDRQLTFAADGLSVVYGPNEAGKSTLLELIRDVLFGFPHRSAYAFSTHNGELAATALISLANGERLRFRRRKGRKNTVQGLNETTHEEIDETGLNQCLSQASGELFRHVFGFSLTELSAGEESLKHAKLNEALFGAGLGSLTSFQAVLDSLNDEHEALYRPNSQAKKSINELLRRSKDQAKALRGATVTPQRYRQHQKELAEHEAAAEQLAEQLATLSTEQRCLEQLRQAVPLWQQLTTAREELTTIDLPATVTLKMAQQFDAREQQLAQLAEEIAEHEKVLTEKQLAIEALHLEPEVVAHQGEIRRLLQDIGQVKSCRRDIPRCEQQAHAARGRAAELLAELNPQWKLDKLDRFAVGLAQRQAIEQMAEEQQALAARGQELAAGRPQLARLHQQTIARLERLDEIPAQPQLASLLEQANTYQVTAQRRAALREETDARVAEAQRLEHELTSPLGFAATACDRLPVPLARTVSEFRQRLERLEQASQRQAQKLATLEQACQQDEHELALLEKTESPIDPADLQAARAERDELWQLIQTEFIHGQPVSPEQWARWLEKTDRSAAEVYQQHVTQADRLADDRYARAKASTRRERLVAQIALQQDHLETERQETERLATELAAEQQAWRELWQACPFEPLSPTAMLDWLHLHEQYRQLCQAIAADGRRLDQWSAELAQFEQQLAQAAPGEGLSVAARLAAATELVDRDRQAQRDRLEYQTDLADQARQLAELDEQVELVQQAQHDWQRRWQQQLADQGFPSQWDVELTISMLTGLERVRQAVAEADQLEARIETMQSSIAHFTSAAQTLSKAVAAELSDLPPEDVVTRLDQRLTNAHQAAEAQRGLVEGVQQAHTWLDKKRQQQQELQTQQQQTLAGAQAESVAQFRQLAAMAARRDELQDQAQALARQVNVLAGATPVDEFHVQLKSTTLENVEQQIQAVEVELVQTNARSRQAVEQVALARNDWQQLEQESEARRLAAQLSGTRAELAEVVDHWAPLKLGQAMLRRAIKRFEREHQPEMLQETTRLFRQMTDGRYVHLERRIDEQGTLLAHEQNGVVKSPDQLSRGAREQLYLAIRLAYVLHYCRRSEPLPLVMDDVLVNFDQDRRRATLAVLAEIAAQVQVVLLTCHEEMVQLAEAVVPGLAPTTLVSSDAESQRAIQPLAK